MKKNTMVTSAASFLLGGLMVLAVERSGAAKDVDLAIAAETAPLAGGPAAATRFRCGVSVRLRERIGHDVRSYQIEEGLDLLSPTITVDEELRRFPAAGPGRALAQQTRTLTRAGLDAWSDGQLTVQLVALASGAPAIAVHDERNGVRSAPDSGWCQRATGPTSAGLVLAAR